MAKVFLDATTVLSILAMHLQRGREREPSPASVESRRRAATSLRNRGRERGQTDGTEFACMVESGR